jgi:transketolase N-terminal domain/subunit
MDISQAIAAQKTDGAKTLGGRLCAFGFAVRQLDGHKIEALVEARSTISLLKEKPSAIIAGTGKGSAYLESDHVK